VSQTTLLPAEAQANLPTANPTSLLAAITRAAADPSVDIDKVERLFAMHERLASREAEAAFNDALARAQAKIVPIATDATNTHTGTAYATLAQINRLIVPLYTAEGLSLSFDEEGKNDAHPIPQGYLRIVGILAHSAGHSRRYHVDLPPDDVGAQGKVNKTKVQAVGSTSTYGQRYLVRRIFNIATREDDDDGNGSAGADALVEIAEQMQAAKTVPELAKLMGRLPPDTQKRMMATFNKRKAELSSAQ